ncbi:MAG TPA: glycosyltransferase family 39 protein [Candidatus Obscuribacterales bacterium]
MVVEAGQNSMTATTIRVPRLGDAAAYLVILPLMLVAYWQSFQCYFVSDDLMHVAYAYAATHTNPELLFLNFVTIWMQDASNGLFWRPLVEPTLAFDCLIWGVNPFGYRLTNFLVSQAGAICLFYLVKRLLRHYGASRARLLALISASLFALNPLHAEVVIWIMGRVDALCVLFYLASFWFFLIGAQDKAKWARILGPAAFALSLMSKEMGVTLPAVLFASSLFYGPGGEVPLRLKRAGLEVLPYFAVTAVYFAVRLLVLGTVGGGYIGAVGDLLDRRAWYEVIQPGLFWKILFPMNEEIISRDNVLCTIMRGVYICLGTSILIQAYCKLWTWQRLKDLSFLMLWMLVQSIPLYQVLFLNDWVQCSRFFYLESGIFSIMLSLMLLPTASELEQAANAASQRAYKYVQCLGMLLFAVILAIWCIFTRANSLAWVEASKQVVSIKKELINAVKQLQPGRKLFVSWLPQQIKGVYMFHHYYMLLDLLRPPLADRNYAESVFCPEPRVYTHPKLVAPSQLRSRIYDKDRYAVCLWDVATMKLKYLTPSGTGYQSQFPDLNVERATGFSDHVFWLQSDHPFYSHHVECIEVEAQASRSAAAGAKRKLILIWYGVSPQGRLNTGFVEMPLAGDGQTHTYRMFVADDRDWFEFSRVNRMFVYAIPDDPQLIVKGARISDGRDAVPSLKPDPQMKEGSDGVYRAADGVYSLSYDLSSIPGAADARVEMSRPYSMFQVDSNTYRDREPSKGAAKSWVSKGAKGRIELRAGVFPEPACYQIRIFALDARGTTLGVSSDPIYLGVKDRPYFDLSFH